MSDYNIDAGVVRNTVVNVSHDTAEDYTHPTMCIVDGVLWNTLKDVPINTPLIEGLFWTEVINEGFAFKGDWDDGTEYVQHDVVCFKNSTYQLKPGLTSLGDAINDDDWVKLLGPSSLTFDPNSLITSDDDGVPFSNSAALGDFSSAGTDGTACTFVPRSKSNGLLYARALGEGHETYGMSFIGSDDDIYTCGYVSGLYRQYDRCSSHSGFYRQLLAHGPRTGTWVGIACSYSGLWAWTSTGELWSMGANNSGQLGDGTTTARYTLEKTTVTNVKHCVVGSDNGLTASIFAIRTDGTLFAVGNNTHGMLGINSTSPTIKAWTQVPDLIGKVKSISIAPTNYSAVMCMMEDDSIGNLYSWGYNAIYQAGIGTNNPRYKPFYHPTMRVKKAYTWGNYSTHGTSHVITVDGEIMSVGSGSYYVGGTGATSTMTNWVTLAVPEQKFRTIQGTDSYAGSRFATTMEKGCVWVWGYNGYGQLGFGSTGTQAAPRKVVIPGAGRIIHILTPAAYAYSFAVVIDDLGQVFSAGYNGNYQTGVSTGTGNVQTWTKMDTLGYKVIGGQITGDNQYTSLTLITEHGRIISCGYSSHWQRGVGTSTQQKLPVEAIF